MEIQGEWVALRPWCVEDAEVCARYANNPAIWRNLRDAFPHPYTVEDARKWIDLVSSEASFRHCSVITVEGAFAGAIGLLPKSDVHCKTLELGYWIGEPFWGQGLVSEAVGIACDYAFSTLEVERIEACVYEWNPASGRVLEKNGFVQEGRQRKAVFKDGELIDQIVYARVKE